MSSDGSTKVKTGQTLVQESENSIRHEPFAFEIKGAENNPPSWLRRMSTLSSLKTTSPAATPRPHSPSISYSNGSTAPILPDFPEPSSSTLSPNKLVKRSSSQRPLQGSNSLHSTLRRPATSHQRSATLQQHYQQDEEPGRSSQANLAMLRDDLSESYTLHNEPSQLWQPFFKSQNQGPLYDSGSRKRNASGVMTRTETSKSVVPEISELPTLLLATSISSGSSTDAVSGRWSNISGLNRPFAPLVSNPDNSSGTKKTISRDSTDPELKPRYSFSLGEMFPSPSPSTWKMPRSGSLMKSKDFNRTIGDRRAVSAPYTVKNRRVISVVPGGGGSREKADSSIGERSPIESSQPGSDLTNVHQRGASSPLPPLNRLSAFEIDLSGAYPPYSTTPQPENPASPPNLFTHSSLTMSSALGPLVTRSRSHRISIAPSERESTLLGSDNDISRLMSGDEDDIDSRSETIYDSTRTGATGSSHSGVRRLPIGTIFDESPPPEHPSKDKLIALQDLLAENSLSNNDHGNAHGQKAPEPVRATVSRERDETPSPMHAASDLSLSETSTYSPSGALKFLPSNRFAQPMETEVDDELWAFDHLGESAYQEGECDSIRRGSIATTNGHLPTSTQEKHELRESPSVNRQGSHSRSNIFEWSETLATDRESPQGDLLRPKTVHGRRSKDVRGSRPSGRRGPSTLHLRSQSVPVPKDMVSHRNHGNVAKLDSWVLGNKGPSEDWDGDFEFDEPSNNPQQASMNTDPMHPNPSEGMLVPRAILDRQASVHGQFGQVKELTSLVEELKRLQLQANSLGIMEGQSVELWKEAEGIINLATLDEEDQEPFPPQSPNSPNFEFDPSDEESHSVNNRSRSGLSPSTEGHSIVFDDFPSSQPIPHFPQESSQIGTPPTSRPRKESLAKAMSVLETIHQQRRHYNPALLNANFAQKKLPFDTTSLKDLVTRAGVVTRALKEIVRRAEHASEALEARPSTPKDPLFSQMFQNPLSPPSITRTTRVTQTTKSPNGSKSPGNNAFLGGSIAGNDNEINGHMKIMTVA